MNDTSNPPQDDPIEDIPNYLRISDLLSTSGQPTTEQFRFIREAGFSAVINLLAHDSSYLLQDEEAIVTGLGMAYVHIPVDFSHPTKKDFDQFAQHMQRLSGEKVWVHCAVNKRVSVFVYKYRCHILGVDDQIALQDVHKIWEPKGVWEVFCHSTATLYNRNSDESPPEDKP